MRAGDRPIRFGWMPSVPTFRIPPLTLSAERSAFVLSTPVPVNDIWIAAATLDCGGTLLTFDRDFERVAGLDRMTITAQEG